MRILLTVSYDGTEFCGWQKQKDENIKTVQGEIEKALEKLFKKETECFGASRTDAGVHALCQKVMFDTETTIPPEKICLALQKFLPKSIEIIKSEEVNKDFNVRFDVSDKTYEYHIYNNENKNPLYRNYSEYVKNPLDINLMNKACKYFLGEHDFKAFCSADTSVKSTIRTIYSLSVSKKEDFVIIKVTGNGFLYNMVRIIAGTLIYVGLNKISPNEIENIIKSKDRRKAGKTASPNGLILKEIRY